MATGLVNTWPVASVLTATTLKGVVLLMVKGNLYREPLSGVGTLPSVVKYSLAAVSAQVSDKLKECSYSPLGKLKAGAGTVSGTDVSKAPMFHTGHTRINRVINTLRQRGLARLNVFFIRFKGSELKLILMSRLFKKGGKHPI